MKADTIHHLAVLNDDPLAGLTAELYGITVT